MKLDLNNLKGKKITVMGLGLHGGGVGVAKWLAKKGALVLVTDLKSRRELQSSINKLKKYKNIKYVLGRHRKDDFKKADLVIQNPGAPRDSQYLKIAGKNKIPIETDISIFFALCPAPIIGITGSKGKTTTTALLAEILKKYNSNTVVGGNIRISPLKFLNKIKKDTPVILELSSWQLEGLKKHKISPQVSLITNIYKEHLNRYRGLKDYIKAKEIIFTYQKREDFAILNFDNKHTKDMGKRVKAKRYWYSLKSNLNGQNGVFLSKKQDFKIIFRDNGQEEDVCGNSDIKIPGTHNLENVLGAVCVAKIYGVSNKIIKQVLRKFTGVKDRMELIKEAGGIKYYNDTTATHPEAAIRALETLSNGKNIILIAGGADKKLEFGDFVKAIKKHTKAVILFKGDAGEKIYNKLKVINYKQSAINYPVDSMNDAVIMAGKIAKDRDIVLLSPGAASFGVFVNEFDRGEQFVKKVSNI